MILCPRSRRRVARSWAQPPRRARRRAPRPLMQPAWAAARAHHPQWRRRRSWLGEAPSSASIRARCSTPCSRAHSRIKARPRVVRRAGPPLPSPPTMHRSALPDGAHDVRQGAALGGRLRACTEEVPSAVATEGVLARAAGAPGCGDHDGRLPVVPTYRAGAGRRRNRRSVTCDSALCEMDVWGPKPPCKFGYAATVYAPCGPQ